MSQNKRNKKAIIKNFFSISQIRSTSFHLYLLIGLSGRNDDSNKNCVTQTTSWSPCSKTCGRGVSARITNKNKQCQMVKESRLCKIRPCEVDFTKHIRVSSIFFAFILSSEWTWASLRLILKERFTLKWQIGHYL